MEEIKKEKLVIVLTHGCDDPERATIPFVMATAALAMDVPVTLILQGPGVTLAKKGSYDHVFAPGFPPLKELMGSVVEQGGTLLACTPCLEDRRITQDMLVESVRPVKAARTVMEILDATTTLNY